MTLTLEWTRRVGASAIYYTTETPLGRVRVSRINKYGLPSFRAYFPDGMNATRDSIAEAQDAAAAYIARKMEEANARTV